MRVRINDAGNVFFYTAREEDAEALLGAGLAQPEGRGKKIRCLRLTVGSGQAWAFLRGGRSVGPSTRTFKVERVGDKRLPIFQHQVERCLEFRPELKVTTEPGQLIEFKAVELEPVGSCEQLPAAQSEIEIAVHSEERGSLAEKGGEEAYSPAELEASESVAVAAKPAQHITSAETSWKPIRAISPGIDGLARR